MNSMNLQNSLIVSCVCLIVLIAFLCGSALNRRKFVAEFIALLLLLGALYGTIVIFGGAYLEARHSAPVKAAPSARSH